MKKIGLTTTILVISLSSPVLAATNNNPEQYLNDTYNPPTSTNPESSQTITFEDITSGINDITSGINGELDGINNTLGGIVGTIDGGFNQLLGIYQDLTSPLSNLFNNATEMANLVHRLIGFPSQIGGWWNVMLGTVTGNIDPCFNPPSTGQTAPFVYEPGWCMGGGTVGRRQGSGSSNSNRSEDIIIGDGSGDTVHPIETNIPQNPDLPPAPPIGRKPTNTGDIIKDSTGEAGIPDPAELRWRMRAAIDDGGVVDLFEANSSIVKHYYGNMGERAATFMNSLGVLGNVGQAKMKQEQQDIQTTVASTLATANVARTHNVTQDVMKDMVGMQASQTMLLGSLVSANQQMRQDNAWSNLNLRNISRSLDQANRDRRLDTSSDAYQVIQRTAQMRLF
ncbi:hypothetical protein [Crocosphaera sp. Alani8]|uniref:hypothetical protein n=1 Tax=Crocosphaera sp. Alani8 TaxID=3038952 RepID=UPI00313EC94E